MELLAAEEGWIYDPVTDEMHIDPNFSTDVNSSDFQDLADLDPFFGEGDANANWNDFFDPETNIAEPISA